MVKIDLSRILDRLKFIFNYSIISKSNKIKIIELLGINFKQISNFIISHLEIKNLKIELMF